MNKGLFYGNMSEVNVMFKRKKVFAYENGEGDKGIIVAKSYNDAARIFHNKYPERKIVDPVFEHEYYWDNGAFLFEAGTVKNNELYCCFPW